SSVPSTSADKSARATSRGPGNSALFASSDAAAQMTTRITVLSAARAAPRIVRLLSRDLVDLCSDLIGDRPHETESRHVPRASRARKIDGDVADDAPGTRPDEDDAIAETNCFFDLMRHEEHRGARRANDALHLAVEELTHV